jgi:3-hydroxybutyryl-CoA dehydrogenase
MTTATYEQENIIGVIGTGIAGTGIAQVIATSGFIVILVGRSQKSLDSSMAKITSGLLKAYDIVNKDRILKNIRATIDLRDIAKADFVIESIIEDVNAKKELFGALDSILKKDTIIATNTSSLSIDDLADVISNRDRFIGLHFFNPIPKMRLVEVVKGEKTSEKTVQRAIGLVERINKSPIVIKNSPCFIVNRILMAYLNEAMWELYDEIATAEEIDNAIKLGLNNPMGPLALVDLIGLDVVLSIANGLYKCTGDKKWLPCPNLVEKVRQGKLGKKTGEGFYTYG